VDATPSSDIDAWSLTGSAPTNQHHQENYMFSSPMPVYMDGSNEIVVSVYPEEVSETVYATYITNGSAGTTTQVSSTAIAKGGGFSASTDHQAALCAGVDGRDVYIAFADATNRDIQVFKNANNSSWSQVEAALTTGASVDRMCGTIYVRAGRVKFGMLWDETTGDPKGTCRFIEYDIRAAPAVPYLSTKPQVTLRGGRP
jgi:hypothetical protein